MDKALIPVRLTLVSTAKDDRGETDQPIRVMTTGMLRKTPSGFMLRYEESSTDDATGEVTTSPVMLTMQPGRVVMTRMGDFGTTMVFVKDTRFEGLYHTPYGDMGLAIFTTQVYSKLSEERGSLRLEYQIDMNGGYAATQTISLEYTADKPC